MYGLFVGGVCRVCSVAGSERSEDVEMERFIEAEEVSDAGGVGAVCLRVHFGAWI